MNPKVDKYLSEVQKWREEMEELRRIALECGLTEELKWKIPVYTFRNNNILGINGLKEYCAVAFFKGSLLNDARGLLIRPGEHTQAGRKIQFSSVKEIIETETILKEYIYEAIEVEKAGLKVEYKRDDALILPEEFEQILDNKPALKKAFEVLTPGRQRAYNLYFSAPKQSKTRTARIEKYMDRILSGKGINDCTCGLSKKLPGCDGSHKALR